MKYETAQCIICKRQFKRLANRSRPRQYCDAEKCQKIKRIKNTVVRSMISLSRISANTEPTSTITEGTWNNESKLDKA